MRDEAELKPTQKRVSKPMSTAGRGISYRVVQHNGQGSTRFECPVEKRGAWPGCHPQTILGAPSWGWQLSAVRLLRNLLMSSFESTNRLGKFLPPVTCRRRSRCLSGSGTVLDYNTVQMIAVNPIIVPRIMGSVGKSESSIITLSEFPFTRTKKPCRLARLLPQDLSKLRACYLSTLRRQLDCRSYLWL